MLIAQDKEGSRKALHLDMWGGVYPQILVLCSCWLWVDTVDWEKFLLNFVGPANNEK